MQIFDDEIADWMNIVCDCFDKSTEYKIDLYNKTGSVGGEESFFNCKNNLIR